jgi:hypothetical protein
MIIFNLALVEHMLHRTSSQALMLYQLASCLLQGLSVEPLRVALINNMGIWCYENDGQEAAERCMEYLSSMLEVMGQEDGVRQAMWTNVVWILRPPYATASAAA